MFKQRFTVHEILQVFVICSFPVHIWSIYNLLDEVPGWILRLSAWELTGAIGYVLAFTLFESVVVFLGVMLLGVMLPSRWLRNKFVPLASVVVLLASIGSISLYLRGSTPDLWGPRKFVFAGSIFVASTGVAYILVQRLPGLERTIPAIVDRLTVLVFVYVFFDLISVLMAIIRNV